MADFYAALDSTELKRRPEASKMRWCDIREKQGYEWDMLMDEENMKCLFPETLRENFDRESTKELSAVIAKFAGTKEAGSQAQKNEEDACKEMRSKMRKENEKLWEEAFVAEGIEACN